MPNKTHVQEFDPQRVRPLPGQPRKRFSGIRELAESIAEIGQSTPGIVSPVTDDPAFDAQLIDGERRLRACKLAGAQFRAEVREAMSVEETFAASFAANFGKQEHDCMEIADGLMRMRDAGKSAEQLARIAGKSTPWVHAHLGLKKLHPDVQQMMVSGEEGEPAKLTLQIAQLLVPMPPAEQIKLARTIVKSELSNVAARRLVLRTRADRGDSVYDDARRTNSRTAGKIDNACEQFADRIGVFLDMPPAEFNRVIDASDNLAKRQLIKTLEKTSDELIDLAEAIEERLPKVGRRSA